MPTPTFRRDLPDHASLQDAVRSARQGRDAAGSFRILEEQVGPRLLRYFRGYSFPDEDAEDLVQAVLARVWQALPGLHAEESFLPWLFAIARNVRRAAWLGRRQERSWRVEGAEVPEVPDPHSSRMLEDRLEAERLAAMRTAIAALPAQQRECLLLRVRHELSYEEIAATLRVSLHTVRNHIAAAKKSLRRRLRLEVVEEVQR
jgi:RNA polymerase sigma-70 factor (ECF subfamily)